MPTSDRNPTATASAPKAARANRPRHNAEITRVTPIQNGDYRPKLRTGESALRIDSRAKLLAAQSHELFDEVLEQWQVGDFARESSRCPSVAWLADEFFDALTERRDVLGS